jgi:ketosteroid isomerase-like protein
MSDPDHALALEVVRSLNREYLRALLAGDAEWYRARLAEDFVCIESDGTLLDKAAFLRARAAGSALADYRLDGVDLRLYGDVALVRGVGAWTAKDGATGTSHYTDVYVRTAGCWRVVSAQVTRPPTPPGASPSAG